MNEVKGEEEKEKEGKRGKSQRGKVKMWRMVGRGSEQLKEEKG